jgi:hypothetical protein
MRLRNALFVLLALTGCTECAETRSPTESCGPARDSNLLPVGDTAIQVPAGSGIQPLQVSALVMSYVQCAGEYTWKVDTARHNHLVRWQVLEGGGSIIAEPRCAQSDDSTLSCTDRTGIAGAAWTVGTDGQQVAVATFVNENRQVRFRADLLGAVRIAVTPESLQLDRGTSAPVTVQLTRTGVAGPVTLTATSAGGVGAPGPVVVEGNSAALFLVAAADAALGTRDIIITATAPGVPAASAVVRVNVVSASLPPYVVSDSSFADAGWEVFQATTTNGSSHEVARVPDGGNPGAHRAMRHVLPPASAVNVRHRFIGAGGQYDPALAPGFRIERIDVRMDRNITFVTAGSGGAVGHAFLIFQGGVTYWADLVAFSDRDWLRRERVGLTATDFVNSAGQHPDFSATAPPLTFGYLRSNSNNSTDTAIELRHGIDNWRVTIHRVQ